MKTSSNGRKLIEQFEGLYLHSYDDANGRVVRDGETAHGTITVGYGHTSAAGAPTVYPGMVITQSMADTILASDLSKVETDVNRLVKVPLTQNQFDALVSFHFNTGSLGKSSILTALNSKNYSLACQKFMLYTKGRVNGQLVPMAGLVRRRKAEQELFNKPSVVKPATTGTVVVGGATTVGFTYWDWIVNHPYETAGIVAVVALIGYAGYKLYRKTKNVKPLVKTKEQTPVRLEQQPD